jgi:hypothetical protein
MAGSLVGPVIGGIMGANAADDAADAQEAAAARSDKTQRYMYDTTRKDNMPMLEARNNSVNQLQYLLGLGGGNSPQMQTREQIRNELLPDYTTRMRDGGGSGTYDAAKFGAYVRSGAMAGPMLASMARSDGGRPWTSDSGNKYRPRAAASYYDQIDNAGLRAAIEARLAEQEAQQNALMAQQQNDPQFGSLMRDYGAREFWNDDGTQLGLQFGLDEGRKGLNRMAAANGSLNSGETLRALTRFGTNYMGTKFNEGFNRDNVKKSTKFNMLSGLAGTGQVGASQIQSAGQNYANNVSANQIGVGNARAASAIGGANAWSNALSGAYNGYQQNQMMNRMFPPKPAFGGYEVGGWD